MKLSFATCFVVASVLGGDAWGQTFPADGAYRPFECGDLPMTDAFQDEPGALAERDVVGDVDAPAGLVALDESFLYLRIRVDEDADPNQLAPFAWGVEFDIDGDPATYEILVLLDGVAGEVAVMSNSTASPRDDPTDPADDPPVATYPYDTHGRTAVAGGSSFGGGDDFFIDIAAEWADLEPLGLTPTTPTVVWVASSSSANALDGDFACHDGASGDPSLTDIAADPTVIDPDADTDGDGVSDADEIDAGTDPNDPNDVPDVTGDTELEGGGGCSTSAGGGPLSLAVFLALLAWRRRR